MVCLVHRSVPLKRYLDRINRFLGDRLQNGRHMLSDHCPVCLSVCNVGVLWPNGWTDHNETWHAGRPRPWPHIIVLHGDSSPPPLKGHSPQFLAHICCGQMAAWIKIPLGTEVGLGPCDFVLDGNPPPLPKRGPSAPTQFSAHVYCGLMAGWSKMVLSTEAGLSPNDFVLGSDPAPLTEKGAEPPPKKLFGPCLLWPNGSIDQDGTWHGGRPQTRRLCVRWGPSQLPKREQSPPQFSAHFYCGQTAECIKMPLRMEVGLSPGDFVL